MPIIYQARNGIEYAAMNGKSVRKNNGSRNVVTKEAYEKQDHIRFFTVEDLYQE